MAPRRKVSERQTILLVEFAESNRDIALGRFAGGPQANQNAHKAWESIASRLNAVAEGSTKTADQWRRYWIEFKAKTKAKAADSRRNASGTGGGPNKLVPLTEAQERVLAIIGKVAVEGLPGVRIPFNVPSIDVGVHSTSSVGIPSIEVTTAGAVERTSATDLLPNSPYLEEWLEEEQQAMYPAPSTTPPVPAPLPSTSSDLPPTQERSPLRAIFPERRQRQRSQRRFQRDERVPEWAYRLEEAHIAAQERLAAAVELLAANVDQRLAGIQAVIAELLEVFKNR